MRLIDANQLSKDIVERGAQLSGCYSAGIARYMDRMLAHVLAEVDTAPTIDAEPRWIPCGERLPKDLEVVNITWINHRPMTYYADIKDKPFTATAIHYKDKWWWYSPICEDLLAECGKSECDKMDADIEVTAWMPLPEPYKGERRDDESVDSTRS